MSQVAQQDLVQGGGTIYGTANSLGNLSPTKASVLCIVLYSYPIQEPGYEATANQTVLCHTWRVSRILYVHPKVAP